MSDLPLPIQQEGVESEEGEVNDASDPEPTLRNHLQDTFSGQTLQSLSNLGGKLTLLSSRGLCSVFGTYQSPFLSVAAYDSREVERLVVAQVLDSHSSKC